MRMSIIKHAAAAALVASLSTGSSKAVAQTPDAPANLLQSCETANVSLHDLAISGSGGGVRSFYEGQALVVAIDQVEPAAASAGLVILLFDPAAELAGDRICFAATGFTGLDLDNAKSSYSPTNGVRLSVPAMDYDHETGMSKPGKPLIVTINAATGSVGARR